MTETLNDREKLDAWNNVCMKKGWSKPRELDKWLMHSGIKFSDHGSAVPDQTMMIMNRFNLDVVLNAVEGEGLATLILEALTGTLMLASTELEEMFWAKTNKRLQDDFGTSIPTDLFPKYIKNFRDPKQYNLFD